METIKNYLEQMFANMPRTPEVLRAKQELLQMMEDKYNELISEGKTENEAVGTVISEFGNLDELADVLNIHQEIEQEHSLVESAPRRTLILDEVKDFLAFCVTRANGLALGVALIILSVNAPILFDAIHMTAVGVALMFLLILTAVAIFIIIAFNSQKWDYISKEPCNIDFATSNYISEAKEQFRSSYVAKITVGVLLCAASWIPVLVLSSIPSTSLGPTVGIVVLLIMVAVGVYLFVHAGTIMNSLNLLLKVNDRETVSGSYNENAVPHYNGKSGERIISIYWPTVRSIYLIWSFLTFQWWKTWIIWPVAGITYAIISSLLRDKSTDQA
ncbi:MAG: permease prefix domain 1-containing protein [Lachnospiraceae bacterium]|nr:permease prefix domain 1-containing protein [Lachnospiraceae bacterium]